MINLVIHLSEEELDYLHKQGRAAHIKIEEYISRLVQEDMAKDSNPTSPKGGNPSWEIEASK